MEEKKKIAIKVSLITVLINFLLSVLKMIAGIVSKSGAMVSDAIHTISDVFSTVIVMIGIKIASKNSDKSHPYGHERFECIASILLSIILFIIGIGIGWNGLKVIFSKESQELAIPGILALISAIISIIVKEWMYWYTRNTALKVDSSSMLADAWHHRSDALSSIGALLGILGARLGFPILDPIAGIIISIFICKAAITIFLDAEGKLVDKSCDDKIREEMVEVIKEQEDGLLVDDIKTRLFGNKIYVDVEIALDGNKTLQETHLVAHKVHDVIEEKFSNVKHCMVHVNPIITEK